MDEQSGINLLNELAEERRIACLRSVASFHYFYTLFWDVISSEEYVDNWHIKLICDELQEVGLRIARREDNPYDIIFNIPPGMSKSSIISQAWPVWLWLIDPSIVIIVTSHGRELAEDNSLKSKAIFKSQRFYEYFQDYFHKVHGHYIRLIRDNIMAWGNNFGGIRYSCGSGGTTGRHAHVVINDDPISAEQAESDAHRRRVWRFLTRTLASRMVNKKMTPTITVMQRLHEDDPAGRALKSNQKIKHYCLPAEVSDKVQPCELKEMYVDGLLDPVRLDRDVLKIQFDKLQSYGYSGQYGQNPFPEGGGRIKKEWFVFIEPGEVPDGIVWDLWIDGAYTDKTSNDPSGLMVAGHDLVNHRMIIRHFRNAYMGMPELLKFIPDYCKSYGVGNIGQIHIEPKASGLSLIQMLRAERVNDVFQIKNKLVGLGKEARSNTAAPKVESGQILIVRDNWNDEFIDQCTGFPNASHDEAVDLIGYATYRYLVIE